MQRSLQRARGCAGQARSRVGGDTLPNVSARMLGRAQPQQCACARPSTTRTHAAFSFAPATPDDESVYGCQMPGFADPLPEAGAIGPAVVAEWAAFMREQGVSSVVVLLGDDELDMHAPPLLDMYRAEHIIPHHISARKPGSVEKINAVFEEATAQKKKVAVHCTGGYNRVGTVLTGWIARKRGVGYAEAAGELTATADKFSVARGVPKEPRFVEYTSGKGW